MGPFAMNAVGHTRGTPRTRQSPLTLAAFRPWGSSQDGRRAGSMASVVPGPQHPSATAGHWAVTQRLPWPRRIRLVAYGARLERGLG
jgi:hypothetical protein